jgi:tetratricopeptide (TPR) repeat protein
VKSGRGKGKPAAERTRPRQKAGKKFIRKSKKKAPIRNKQAVIRKTPKQSSKKESASMASGTRKRISEFGTVIPAPEKPPQLLRESKTTTAALSLLERGIKFLYQKDVRKARQEFESIISNYPGEAEIVARSRSYLQICEREEASHKKPAIAQDQLYSLGVMEHNQGNYDGAISYLQQSLEKNPNADFVYYSLAASKAMKNDVVEALENLRKAIELNEDNRVYAKNDPDFASLHWEKEFADLVGLKSV